MMISPGRLCFRLLIVLTAACCFWTPDAARAQVRAQAVAGEPFGVGCVEVSLPRELYPEVLGLAGLKLTEKNGRVLYPAVRTGELGPVLEGVKDVLSQSRRPAGRLLGDLLSAPPKTTVYFLFQGDAPLEVTFQSRRAVTLVVVPEADPVAYRKLFGQWWRRYTAAPGPLVRFFRNADYPPQVENYLKSMLAYRLGLGLPTGPGDNQLDDFFKSELGLVLGTESVRISVGRDRFLSPDTWNEPADQPLPEPVAVPDLEIPDPPEGVKVEPIAARVPAECLYVRFGSFANFLWFQDMLAQWGGDLQNLVALRGLSHDVKGRMEESLVVKQTALARLLGGTVIADVAIIGTDVLFQEGGAFGLLFHARNNLILGGDFNRQRQERLQKGDGVTEEKIRIDGREVSFLSSPDGWVRSYYAADGDFHFVTRSRTLMKRFLQTGSGIGALGTSKEFRYARSVLPLDRSDTVFIYLSDAFFRNFVGPHYRLETARRVQAVADVELLQLALLASATEGKAGETIEQLAADGFLPANFGTRPDGSRAVLGADGRVYDSLRGHRGALVPVPDVELGRVSRSEAAGYRQFCDFYRANWQRLDPVMVGIKREELEGGRERVVFDARMTPFARQNYERLKRKLGPPSPTRLASIPGDGIALDAELSNQRLFMGLREIRPPSREWLERGILRGLFNVFVGYVGTTGEMGFLSLFNTGIQGPPDEAGYASSPDGMWRRREGQFTVFSFQPEVLDAVVPQLRFEEAQRPAQIRVRVVDVSQAGITPMLNNIGYARTRETSIGNLRLMHQLAQQLHVPDEDCKDAAELLLGAELICPLRGEYVYRETADGTGCWTSTALADQPAAGGGLLSAEAPDGFVAPPLSWFRGLDADVTITPGALSLHAELVLQMPQQ